MWKALSNIQSVRAIELPGTQPIHWGRVVMNEATNQLVSQLNTESLKVLEISGQDWIGRFNYKSYQSVTYPDFDICSDKLGETFDLIIAEQVFEHLLYPYKAARNIYSMLDAGGHLLITTPFLIKVHEEPFDCTRWTETGMKYFLSECGFQLDNIITGSWGNRACVKSNLYRWTNFNKWIHSLKNEPDFPLVVWVMAKRQS
jgi:SAM-dependent methyltransferase